MYMHKPKKKKKHSSDYRSLIDLSWEESLVKLIPQGMSDSFAPKQMDLISAEFFLKETQCLITAINKSFKLLVKQIH